MREFVDESVELRELVCKMTNWYEAFSLQAVEGLAPNSEVENLCLLLASKDHELFKSKRR
jgi:hypothetical protein